MRIEREWLRNLIFEGRDGRRFTQDSPILPDVWLAGGLFYCADPAARVDLILTPYNGCSPNRLAAKVRARLNALRESHEREHAAGKTETARRLRGVYQPDEKNPWGDKREEQRVLLKPTPRVAVNQTNVVVSVTLEELIVVVLPLSLWWRRNVAPPDDPNDDMMPKLSRVPSEKQRAGEIAWMRRVVGVLRLCSEKESESQPDLARLGAAPAILSSDEARRLRRPKRDDAQVFEQFLHDEAAQWDEFEALRASAEELQREGELAAARAGEKRQSASQTEPDLRRQTLLWTVTLNRGAHNAIEKSVPASKGDAARNLFNIDCSKICWAVVDSGIDLNHEAFKDASGQPRVQRIFDFTQFRSLVSLESHPDSGPGRVARTLDTETRDRQAKRVRESLRRGRYLDWEALLPLIEIPRGEGYRAPVYDHGTHVAGIIAARETEEGGPNGMCPTIQLMDFRVLNDEGLGDEFSIIAALQFIRFLNANAPLKVIHGVNLSLSLLHDVENFACGRTPICEECERLVDSGVVVVAAAGNRGYERVLTSVGELEAYRSISITDPGNASSVITVGSTHRFEPHSYGVSYFSSRGPTGDGRVKPDLLAPGEKIESTVVGGGYAPKDGTSMAAPHVSGAAALLMARHTEFIDEPGTIKDVLCRSATDLGRERYFQGAGMLDVLRALQLK
jgi:serine protease AprX